MYESIISRTELCYLDSDNTTLCRYINTVGKPERITVDVVFRFAGNDDPGQELVNCMFSRAGLSLYHNLGRNLTERRTLAKKRRMKRAGLRLGQVTQIIRDHKFDGNCRLAIYPKVPMRTALT